MALITVRRAIEADAEQLSLFYQSVHALHANADPLIFKPVGPATFPASDWLKILHQDNNVVFVAGVDDVSVGYVYADVRRIPDNWGMYSVDYSHINHIGVNLSHQGMGIGRALMAHVKSFASDRHIEHLSLDVWSFNERARRFFIQQGFSPQREFLASRLQPVIAEESLPGG